MRFSNLIVTLDEASGRVIEVVGIRPVHRRILELIASPLYYGDEAAFLRAQTRRRVAVSASDAKAASRASTLAVDTAQSPAIANSLNTAALPLASTTSSLAFSSCLQPISLVKRLHPSDKCSSNLLAERSLRTTACIFKSSTSSIVRSAESQVEDSLLDDDPSRLDEIEMADGLSTLTRFLFFLVLYDLITELSIPAAIAKYAISKSRIQELQQNASKFAGIPSVSFNSDLSD